MSNSVNVVRPAQRYKDPKYGPDGEVLEPGTVINPVRSAPTPSQEEKSMSQLGGGKKKRRSKSKAKRAKSKTKKRSKSRRK
jgi:hypothetical protein